MSGDSHPPRVVYDDNCGFCTWCAEFALRHGDFEAVGFSELSADQQARLPADFERCMHLLTDDEVYSCGEAAEQTFARMSSVLVAVVAVLRRVPGYAWLRERVYGWASRHRDWWGKFKRSEPPAGG